jgi:hypothetical protein
MAKRSRRKGGAKQHQRQRQNAVTSSTVEHSGKWAEWQRSGLEADGRPRPTEPCVACSGIFLPGDAFHYTRTGPYHGWGGQHEVGTCTRAKKSVKPSANGGGHNQCKACGESITKKEQSHTLRAGGRVHGPGGPDDDFTCPISHRQGVNKRLKTVSARVLAGEIEDSEIETMLVSLRAHEARFAAAYAPKVKD